MEDLLRGERALSFLTQIVWKRILECIKPLLLGCAITLTLRVRKALDLVISQDSSNQYSTSSSYSRYARITLDLD